MEKIRNLLAEANQFNKTADHLTYTTYPAVRETKMLLLIANDIYKSMIKAMEAILRYERLYKRIPPINGNFDAELETFKNQCARRYNIDRGQIAAIIDLKILIEEHEKSPVEFVRKDKFIICSQEYRLTTLNIQKIKEYLSQSSKFLERASALVRQK
ncbi:hypothetical protein HY643_04750 [Candidatus Woesearchaeota archaeon]|nr:hypothetical protein [Candidatus Woesearchaeota archaeon]